MIDVTCGAPVHALVQIRDICGSYLCGASVAYAQPVLWMQEYRQYLATATLSISRVSKQRFRDHTRLEQLCFESLIGKLGCAGAAVKTLLLHAGIH